LASSTMALTFFGIATVHQEFSTIPYLPVYQNIWPD
jgi:ABC-type sugar transport system ATPase subunit